MKAIGRRGRPLGRRGRVVAGLAAAALAVGAGAAVASPPRSAVADELDGRTWVPAPGAGQLLLVNGISGLIEAAVDVGSDARTATTAPPVFVDGTDGAHTVLHGEGGLVVIDDADHTVATRSGTPAAGAVVGDRLLVLAGTTASWLALDPHTPQAVATPVPGAPAPKPDTAPVVDAAGNGWYLAADTAVEVPRDGGAVRTHPVEPDTERLVVVDGTVHSVAPSGIAAVADPADARDVEPSPDRVDPSIAVATGGRWASATGTTIRTTAPDDTVDTVDAGADVRDLAVWHGRVVAVTADAVLTGPAGALAPIAELGPGASLHEDGGLLWAVTRDTAVAIHPNHDRTVLRIADADLSLCVGDCSPAAASSFLERATPTTTTPPAAPNAPTTTTTAPPRRLTAETVPPTTAPEKPAGATTTAPTTTAVPTTTAAPPTTPTTPTTGPPPSTLPPVTTTSDPKGDRKDPKESDPPPFPRLPPLTTTTAETVPPTTTTSEPEPPTEPTTEPAPDPVGLNFDVIGRTGSAEAVLRVLATAAECDATGGTTTATLTWEGSDHGSRELLVTWRSSGSRRSEESSATIVADAGELTVTVTVCGVTATESATVRGLPTTTTTAPPSTTTTTPSTTTPPTTPTTPPTTPPPTTTTTTAATTTTTRPTTPTTAARAGASAGAAAS